MFGMNRPKAVDEYEATGETERVYHEMRQVLRVPGVNLVFRVLADYEPFFSSMWAAMRPNAETRAFESSADTLRKRAVAAAGTFPGVQILQNVDLGPSQIYQIKAALRLYHYINPKLLLFVSAVRLSMRGESGSGSGAGTGELIERGICPELYPMEMVDEDAMGKEVTAIFDDIKKTLNLPAINSDYRTLALWPPYLSTAWRDLKPVVKRPEFEKAAAELRSESRHQALSLPLTISMSRGLVKEMGGDPSRIEGTLEEFETLLPALILNIAILQLDAAAGSNLLFDPCPAETRRPQGVRV